MIPEALALLQSEVLETQIMQGHLLHQAVSHPLPAQRVQCGNTREVRHRAVLKGEKTERERERERERESVCVLVMLTERTFTGTLSASWARHGQDTKPQKTVLNSVWQFAAVGG